MIKAGNFRYIITYCFYEEKYSVFIHQQGKLENRCA